MSKPPKNWGDSKDPRDNDQFDSSIFNFDVLEDVSDLLEPKDKRRINGIEYSRSEGGSVTASAQIKINGDSYDVQLKRNRKPNPELFSYSPPKSSHGDLGNTSMYETFVDPDD